MFAAAQHAGRHLCLVAWIAQRLDRGAGSNPAEKGQADGIGGRGDAAPDITGHGTDRFQNFDGPCPVGKTADIAAFLKAGHQSVNA